LIRERPVEVQSLPVQARATVGLNWLWIGIALTVPILVGLIAALAVEERARRRAPEWR
jgi:hypothetical protein